jgi:hypothetical protein
MLTPYFFGKTCQKKIRRSGRWESSIIDRLKKEKVVNRGSPMVKAVQPGPYGFNWLGDGQPGNQPMERRWQSRICQRQNMVEAGLGLGRIPDTHYPYPNYPNPNPTYSNPRYPIPSSDSDCHYPNLVWVIRVIHSGTQTTRTTRNLPLSLYLFTCTTKNLVIHDDIHMTFSDFVIDHTASMTNCQISS